MSIDELVIIKCIPERDELIKQGYCLPEMAEKLDLDHTTILYYMKLTKQHEAWKALRASGKGKTDNPHAKTKLRPNVRDPERDKFIGLGYSQQEIADRVKKDRTTMSYYIQETGQNDIWKKAKHDRRQLAKTGMSDEEIDFALAEKMKSETLLNERIYNRIDDNSTYATHGDKEQR